ncbi:MAG: hypothetical protein J6Y67_03395 [Lachnospiraceae bacterium]|nr:hypothetical protein [Lachnospiraceae bacterium]
MEAIQILGCVVLVIGILLIGVEFILPGFGLPGISGTILVVIGIYLTGKNGSERIIVGVVTIVVIAAILVVDLVLFNSKKIKSPIKLDTDLQGKNLFIEEKDMEYLIGRRGTAITDLRPSGKGEFDGVKLDVTASDFINKGTKLVITSIKNNRIFVEEA